MLTVIEHGSVHKSRLVVSESLEILVVGGDDAHDLVSVELAEYGLGERTANLRLGARAHLIHENERAGRGTLHEHLHVLKMRAVRAQVILYGLLVAYIYKDI